MKIKGAFSVFVLIAFIIGAPAISYIYLTFGLDYRMDALEALQPKATFQPFQLVVDSSDVLVDEDLHEKVTVVSYVEGTKEDWVFLNILYNQYKARKELQFWTFYDQATMPDSLQGLRAWQNIELGSEAYQSWIETSTDLETPNFHHLLVDTAMNVRKIYKADLKEDKTSLIEHLAIVLPRTAESDIIYEVPERKE